LTDAAERGARYRERVSNQPVYPAATEVETARQRLGDLHDEPVAAGAAIGQLVSAVEPALVASAGPRYFGFVTGGALDAASAADILTTAWDQNGFNAVTSPAGAVVEEVTGAWLKELLGLPPGASFGFSTGAQGANTVCLAAARHKMLADAGWDVEQQGLMGAPTVRVLATAERHVTIDRALRLLGFGAGLLEPVATDAQGAIHVAELARALADGPRVPTIVCLQAGNVNSGAFDDFTTSVTLGHQHGAWVHVDGAFGLWAAANPATRRLVAGVQAADSWTVDGHKWLNVPYDSGYAVCAHPEAHAAAISATAAYLKRPAYLQSQGNQPLRSPGDYVLELSRRARGFATWAALRQLGRSGIAELVERCCSLARRFAAGLAAGEGVRIVNDVVLNQVLVRFADDDDETDRVIDVVQRGGECWMGPTTWHDMRLMRISVSNWRTTEADVDRSVATVLAAASGVVRP
jgi:glutamate/tyrosine decarboxylase-like PLP-dependent enzyme